MRSLIDACNAVAYAHSRGVVHRDLKPDNIMLGRFGETLVVDWGLAKAVAATEPAGTTDADPAWQSPDDSPSLTRPGSALGTPQYMSPEQALGDLDRVGPASDVYSLGATLYCLLVGHGPFSTGGVADVIQRVSRGIFPAPRRLRRSIDPALEATCLKAMAVQPADRHATPLALAEGIEAWMADVRYRGEQERALGDVKRSLARPGHRARPQPVRAGSCTGEGMLWLARALENVPPDSPVLDRAVRASLGGWHAGGEADGTHPRARRRRARRGVQPRRPEAGDGVADRHGAALGRRHGLDARRADGPRRPPSARFAFSPDGRRSPWRRSGATTGAVPVPHGDAIRHEARVTAVRFGPDGSRSRRRAGRTALPLGAATGASRDSPAVGRRRHGSRSRQMP